nr:hypothetical protein [Tanacetum cinerariifolium]
MDQQYPTVAKIPILDTGKFEQWQFRIQQYLQHEHYALWEIIEFRDSYEVPASTSSTMTTDTTSGETGKKSGRTVTLTAEDVQKKKNDAKARTTLLLSLPDEQQLRFNVEIEQDDLNKKFLTSLSLKWLMHTIVWRNRSDLDTMSLDDFYNHLKVYESEVHKKLKPNSQNMAFISSAKHSSGNEDGNTACVPTASISVPTASASVINKDDMEETDIKWNMTLLSIRADKFWKKTGKKISTQGSDMAGFDKSKSYMENDEEDHALVADEVAPTEFALMANPSAESKKIKTLKQEKEGVDGKLAGLLTASKNLDNLIESQRSDKNKDRLGYNVVPPPPAQLYSSPKKNLS